MKKQHTVIAKLLSILVLFALLPGISKSEETVTGSRKELGQFLGAKETEYPRWFKDSFLEFEEDVQEAALAGKRVLLFFHQHGCPYCNALVERNLSQKDIAELMQQHLDVIAINMWGDRELVSVAGDSYTEKSFAAALRVQFTPTLIFFNEQGKIILRLNGYLPPQRFRLALNYVVNKRETQQSYRDYIAANTAPASAGELNRQTFFEPPPYQLQATDKPWARPLAVFFEQKHCPNCDILHQNVLSDKTTRTLIEQFQTIQLDMWSDTPVITPDGKHKTARQWAKQLDINYAPSIVLFNRNGKEVIRSEAYFKTFHTQSIFDYVLTESHKTQPSFQRYLSARADRLRDQGIDVDIWH